MIPVYCEPSLSMCCEDNPNTMGMCVTLSDPIDKEALRSSVEKLRERFPYFYVRAKIEDNRLIAVPNPLPVVIRDTWDPILLCSEEANYHMLTFKYEGNRMALEMCHSISDGAGFLPFCKSVLYCYLSTVTGRKFDPAGFRLPGEAIPETETGNPFPEADVEAAKAPFYIKPPVKDFYRLTKDPAGEDRCVKTMYIKLPEDQVMQYCKGQDASPNILFSVLIARAIRRMDPASGKTVTCEVAYDHKTQVGYPDNYRMFVEMAVIDMPKESENYSVRKACTIGRGQLMLQVQPENSLYLLNRRRLWFEKLEQMPLQMRVDAFKEYMKRPQATASVSYIVNRSFGPLDDHISELYFLTEPSATDVMCETACINHSFFLTFSPAYVPDKLFEAFLAELDDAQIPYDITRVEPFNLCGVRYDGIEGIHI